MRTLSGGANRVIVVGAGLGGLACALHLAGARREVTVVERDSVPGGPTGKLELNGYRFDTGPGSLAAPELLAEPLAAVGERLQDWIELQPLEPAYRAHFQDGSTGLVQLGIAEALRRLDPVTLPVLRDGRTHMVMRAISAGLAVTRVETRGDRAIAVHTADGERLAADAVVLNPDLAAAFALLPGGPPAALGRLRANPSCVLLHLGARIRYGKTVHHNLHFGRDWARGRHELIERGELMSDPSLLVTHTTWADNSAAPPGRDTYCVLAPVPNLQAAPVSWSTAMGRRYAGELMATLEARGYLDLGLHLEVSHVMTPSTWARAGLAAGSPFSHARTFRQAGPLGPGNLHPNLSNVVFAGTGTHPGVGVPMVLISGKLAASRVVS